MTRIHRELISLYRIKILNNYVSFYGVEEGVEEWLMWRKVTSIDILRKGWIRSKEMINERKAQLNNNGINNVIFINNDASSLSIR